MEVIGSASEVESFCGGRCPPGPLGFNAWDCTGRGYWPSEPGKIHPALPVQAPDRRSGCVPAEPYPPLEQSVGFPFPFPLGGIGRETGKGNLSW